MKQFHLVGKLGLVRRDVSLTAGRTAIGGRAGHRVAALAAAGVAGAGGMVQGGVRVVEPGAVVQSYKRGVAANQLSAADFSALNKGVSWYYDWSSSPILGGTGMEFVPMAWDGTQGSLSALSSYLAAGNRPRTVLAVNEPNLKGQAFITPQQTATAVKAVKAIADGYGVPVSGPQMALGSATADSITAFDPVQNKTVTYTSFQPFVRAYQYYMGNVSAATLGYHTYGNIGELKWSVGEAVGLNNGGKVYVTEFAWWDAPTVTDARNYMIQAVDYLERTAGVEGYAWFKERDSYNRISLLTGQSGVLSSLGQTYVAMPVHDADLYYQANGKLQAERYVTMNNMEIGATSDTGADSLADMVATANGGSIKYNVFADVAGVYSLSLRVKGEWGMINILDDGVVIGSVWMDAGDWRTLSTQIPLPAGTDTIELQFQRTGQVINWLSLSVVPEPGMAGWIGVGGVALLRRWRGHA